MARKGGGVIEVAITVTGIVAIVAIGGLTAAVIFLTRKIAQRDNDFVARMVDNTMENMVTAYWRGVGDRNIRPEAEGPGPMIPGVPSGVAPGPPGKPEDEDVQEVGIN